MLLGWGWYLQAGHDYDTFGGDVGDDSNEMSGNLPVAPFLNDVVDMVALEHMACVLEDHDGDFDIECIGFDVYDRVWTANRDDSDWIVTWSGHSYGTVVTMWESPAHLDLSALTPSWNGVSGLTGGWNTVCAWDSSTAGAVKC